MDIKDFLAYMVENNASDLFLTTGAPPSVKINGSIYSIAEEKFLVGEVQKLCFQVLDSDEMDAFLNERELNKALSIKGVGRFRVNMFKQRGEEAMVIRHIKSQIPALDELRIPEIVTDLCLKKRGLILFVGATGTGKSTSLAALIDYRNKTSKGHIITIEDPIEYVHRHKNSIINQREVGIDTESYDIALKNTLRQAPDVILIGEIRSQDTMNYAITFAETGHLCMSTLHANNANQALDRIINFFPEERHKQLLLDLSLNLRAIISQRLIPTKDGGRVAAFEVLINTPMVAELIKRGEVLELKTVMQKSESLGMQTFDSALYHLYMNNEITLKEALRNADSENNLRLRISLAEGVNSEKDKNQFALQEDIETLDLRIQKDLDS